MSTEEGNRLHDWQTSCKKVVDRSQYLLDNGLWSDCCFVVGTDANEQVLRGHKLFLAMASPVFEAMLFGSMAENDPIVISDVQPDAFKALLQFIYTDHSDLTSFDQACELCYAAKKYMLPELVERCTKFLWSDLNPRNACRAYEFAKLFEEPVLIEKCQQIICHQTEEVLKESSFEDVELDTILMIFDRDELNVTTELALFNALSRYAAKNSNDDNSRAKIPRTNSTDDASSSNTADSPSVSVKSHVNLKPTIREALMKIRFLTLTPQAFAEVSDNCQLLSEAEKYAILMNICSANSAVPMPPGFSTIKKERFKILSTNSSDIPLNLHNSMRNQCRKMLRSEENMINTDMQMRMYCTRQLIQSSDGWNNSVMDCVVSFTCDKNVCIYGIQVPSQLPTDPIPALSYSELLYAHLLDTDGSRLTYTHFTSRVNFRSLIDITFNRPIYIQRNKMYKVGVVLNKAGSYPVGIYSNQTQCHGVTFFFSPGTSGEAFRDGLIRALIFDIPHSQPCFNGESSHLNIS